LLLVGSALPASAEFIITDRTVANGNPLAGNYNGQPMLVGVTGYSRLVKVPGLRVDVVDPAQFGYSDQTGGGMEVWSNAVVRVQGGSFGQLTASGFGGGLQMYDTSARCCGCACHRQWRLDSKRRGRRGAGDEWFA
jgi:hypothetical protein